MRPNGLFMHPTPPEAPMSAAAATFPATSSALEHPAVNPWLIAVTVTLATFMELLDTAIANVALPHIAGGLAVSVDESTWVLTSYLVSNAVVLPLSAWLSRVFGRKRYYMICVMLFTVSSLLCGFAPSLGALIFFSRAAGDWRRRVGAGGAGDFGGYVSGEQKSRGVCVVQHGNRDGAGDWAAAGRMDYRSLELAVVVFYQHTDWDCVVAPVE